MEPKTIRELMIPLAAYPHVYSWSTLREAIIVIEKCRIEAQGCKSLPRMVLILDEADALAGVLRRRDIMRGLEPQFLVTHSSSHQRAFIDVLSDPNAAELSFDHFIKEMVERTNRRVKEFMLPIEATIDVDDHLVKAIQEMVELNTSLLPVMRKDRVIGVLRSVDVFKEISLQVIGREALEMNDEPK